ncbi:DUF2971 domain-containing protein [Microbulbifer sp. SSSA002]|uniref:DUF2971 domain-containing protein n=1 Tax=Microbulbifer sp. SSSA002 TaxID=3243376 RepID=UPI0040394B80
MSIRTFKFRFGTERDFDALHENYIWFADFTSLNDPFEGYARFNTDGISHELRMNFLKKYFPDFPLKESTPEAEVNRYHRENYENKEISFSQYVDSWAKDKFEELQKLYRNKYFVFSQSKARDNDAIPSPLNNLQMWAHYANGFKGYCIEFDFNRLKESIQSSNSVMLNTSPVKYPEDRSLPTVNLKSFMQSCLKGDTEAFIEILKAFNVKERNWIIENEVRFTSLNRGKHYYDPSSIRAIYIAEKMPSLARESVISIIESKRSNIKIFDVRIGTDEYKLGFSPANLTG